MANDLVVSGAYNREQIDHIKNIICKGATDDETTVFLHMCKKLNLDPFAKQIYFVSRWDGKLGKNLYTPQVSIDGLRLVAERSGKYCPGRETTFEYDKDGKVLSATAYVKKRTADGTWHEIGATAYWDEYVQMKNGLPVALWGSKPRVMLAKCAESICLRKCFPNELSGAYTVDEMGTDEKNVVNVDLSKVEHLPPVACITQEEAQELSGALGLCSPEYQDEILAWCAKEDVRENLTNLPRRFYEKMRKTVMEKSAEHQQSIEIKELFK